MLGLHKLSHTSYTCLYADISSRAQWRRDSGGTSAQEHWRPLNPP